MNKVLSSDPPITSSRAAMMSLILAPGKHKRFLLPNEARPQNSVSWLLITEFPISLVSCSSSIISLRLDVVTPSILGGGEGLAPFLTGMKLLSGFELEEEAELLLGGSTMLTATNSFSDPCCSLRASYLIFRSLYFSLVYTKTTPWRV